MSESWKLASGEPVLDRPDSHLHSGVRELLPEALAKITSEGRVGITEVVDFGRVIGKTTWVETRPGDEIVWARRTGRSGLTKFARNRQPEDCTKMVVVLQRKYGADGVVRYMIRTAFIGYQSSREPWDPNATDADFNLWETHALAWGVEQIVPGSETSQDPCY